MADSTEASERTLEDLCKDARIDLHEIELLLRSTMQHSRYAGSQRFVNQHGEMRAQTMLAVRHIEDARMRCGKILQYADDGVSILDKDPKGAANV